MSPKSLLLPVGAYLFTTLLLPLLNGAASPRFWAHARAVLLGSAVVSLVFLAVTRFIRRRSD
jgi:hypothetical protein